MLPGPFRPSPFPPNPFKVGRTALLGLHAAGIVATHVMAGAVLGALGVTAVVAVLGKRMAERKEPR